MTPVQRRVETAFWLALGCGIGIGFCAACIGLWIGGMNR